MPHTYCLNIKHDISVDDAWEELSLAGIEPLYSEEDPESCVNSIFCIVPDNFPLTNLKELSSSWERVELNTDWDSQWNLHAANFYDGLCHIETANGQILLKPGPGFGDASHPTTRLVMKMMIPQVIDKTIIDLGCGSGILTLASLKYGAKYAYAIDIEAQAIDHTRDNIRLNDFEQKCWTGSASDFGSHAKHGHYYLLMNMISSEQKLAWSSLAPLHSSIQEVIVSGVIKEEASSFLSKWKDDGWDLAEDDEEEGWCCFRFKRQ